MQFCLTSLLKVILIYCCPSEIFELFEMFSLNLLVILVLNSVHEASACTYLSRQLFLYLAYTNLVRCYHFFRTRI